jgi:hypothetical protein
VQIEKLKSFVGDCHTLLVEVPLNVKCLESWAEAFDKGMDTLITDLAAELEANWFQLELRVWFVLTLCKCLYSILIFESNSVQKLILLPANFKFFQTFAPLDKVIAEQKVADVWVLQQHKFLQIVLNIFALKERKENLGSNVGVSKRLDVWKFNKSQVVGSFGKLLNKVLVDHVWWVVDDTKSLELCQVNL